MKITVTCDDKYEAQKLASLIYNKDGKETFLTNVLSIFDNELVISIKDKSAHSVLLKDENEVVKVADFFQSIIENKHKITSAEAQEKQVSITKE